MEEAAEAPAEETPAEETPAEEETEEPAEPALPTACILRNSTPTAPCSTRTRPATVRGTLTVKDGQMTIHVSLVSKTILNLYPGLAEDAKTDGAELLQPTTDTVTYSDGLSDEVYGFDIPVPALDTEFDLALIGKKGRVVRPQGLCLEPRPDGRRRKTVSDLGLAGRHVYWVEVARGRLRQGPYCLRSR